MHRRFSFLDYIEAQISKASMGVCMYKKVKPKTIHVVACNAGVHYTATAKQR